MASRDLPGLGLKGDWDLGEDGWKDENDLNLLKLSVLTQGSVAEKVAVLPGAPAEGDIVLLDETHATHPNEIAVYDEAAWVYILPRDGMLIYNVAAGYYEKYDATLDVWAELATGGGGGGGDSFSGAALNLGGVNTAVNNATIPFNTVEYDAGGWYSAANNGFVVPAGVAKVRVNVSTILTTDPADTQVWIKKNGTQYGTIGGDMLFGSITVCDTFSVDPGDIIQAHIGQNITLNGSANLTRLTIEAVEKTAVVNLPVTPLVTEAGTAVDLLDGNNGFYQRFTAATAKVLTVRPEADHALTANGEWHIRNAGANDLTLVEGTGVTIHPPAGGTLVVPERGSVTLKRVAEDEFDLLGQTVPA